METTSKTISAWFNKFYECFIAYVLLRDLAYTYFPFDTYIFNTELLYFQTLFTGWNLLIFILVLAFSFWWNHKEMKASINSPAIHEWLRCIICYYTAFLLFMYGFAKLYNNQFHQTYYRNDMLTGHLTGFGIAWSFFNYSFYFTFIIGCLQVIGGLLLLSKRARLFGCAMLLPIMVNIFMINIFYGVSPAAMINAVLILLAISYILWLRRMQFVKVFFANAPGPLSKTMRYLQAIIAILVIIFSYKIGYPYKEEGDQQLAGKWKIIKMIRNGKLADQTHWQTDSSDWNNVYIEGNGKLAFSANPNYYDYSKNRTVSYRYKSMKNKLLLTGHSHEHIIDSTTINFHRYDANNMQWSTILQGDTLQMTLARDTVKNVILDKDLR